MNYSTLVVDPAWDSDRSSAREGVLESIRNLPVSSLSTDSAHLYLWIPDCLAAGGIELMRDWGFSFKTMLLWLKHQASPGEFFPNAHELILFGVKGGLPTLRKDVRTWFMADCPPNDRKPDDFYRLAEQASPAPRIMLLGKEKREGWDQWDGRIDLLKDKGGKTRRSSNGSQAAGGEVKALNGWITCEALAQHTNISVATLRRWSLSGAIPCNRIGRLVRYNLKEVEVAMLKNSDSLVGRRP